MDPERPEDGSGDDRQNDQEDRGDDLRDPSAVAESPPSMHR